MRFTYREAKAFKITRTTNTSYAIILPKRWADMVGLEDNPVVEIYMLADGSLLIRKKEK